MQNNVELPSVGLDEFYSSLFVSVEKRLRSVFCSKRYILCDSSFNCFYHDFSSYELIHSSLEHLIFECEFKADYTLHFADSNITDLFEISFFKLKKSLKSLHRDSDIERYLNWYVEELEMLIIFDRINRRAIFFGKDFFLRPQHDRICPIIYHLFLLLGDVEGAMLHGALVGRNGKGVLIIGRSGSGKSTLALACLEAGFQYVCDDRCYYKRGFGYSLSQFARLTDSSLEMLPQFLDKQFLREYYPDGKLILPLYSRYASDLLPKLEVSAILSLFVSEDNNPHLMPCSPADAFKVLAPSSMNFIYGRSAKDMRIMADLTRSVPAYKLFVTNDLSSVVTLVDEVLSL